MSALRRRFSREFELEADSVISAIGQRGLKAQLVVVAGFGVIGAFLREDASCYRYDIESTGFFCPGEGASTAGF